jgi:hypothetical protein
MDILGREVYPELVSGSTRRGAKAERLSKMIAFFGFISIKLILHNVLLKMRVL